MASGGWSSLPADLLREVSGLLPANADHLRIHQVCTHWRASSPPPPAYSPWVLAGTAWWCGLVPIRDVSLRLPRRGAPRLDAGDPPAGLPYCCGTSFGWLALVDDQRFPTRLVLWDPISNAQIPLPCQSPLTRVFLSGDPLTSPSWAAIATQPKGLLGQTALVWRPGDAAWTMMYEDGTMNIIICDLGTGTDGDLPPKITRIHHVQPVVNSLCRCDTVFHQVSGVHLVTCNGDLLLVVLRKRGSSHLAWAEVYRPEWTSCESGCPGVLLRERVMDLGDYSLFLGASGHTFALSAKEFPAIKRNCIYYTGRAYYDDKLCWISVFNLKLPRILEKVCYPEPGEVKQGEANWWRSYAWFCPRAARAPFHKQQ
ncbi:hypothetical protein PVAP13_4KG074900 [Panicum virgatum]|uniref:KIB1-4 beta-propeller domain-containing protein n=1 Tax=Panicum virgatum TaxID=38727 RepID=A0A8T0TLD3_PANVG|nr:hypothetical protein PVAP13_4KG074900 [Panicum virgatum]